MADMLVGHDTKYDFMAASFKTSFLTYCDDSHKGRVGAVSVIPITCTFKSFKPIFLATQLVTMRENCIYSMMEMDC